MIFRDSSTPSLTETVKDRLLNHYEVRPFPRVVVKLMEAVRNPNISMSEVGQIVQTDAALCTKVLRMANSPLIGASQRINRIDQALTILGFNRIKNLAQTHAAAAIMAGNGSHLEIRRALWQHSLACATACRVIALKLNAVDEAEAFLAGIFHDVGHLFFLDVVPQVYAPMMREHPPLKIVEQESLCFGIDHQDVGVRLSFAWELPNSTRTAIDYHHRPGKAISQQNFAWVVNLADRLVHFYQIGSSHDTSVLHADLLRGPWRINGEMINAIRLQTIEEFTEYQQMYN
jgi:HD-like signal output (HDOD) protein